jgi:hypothetical protein
VAREPLARAAWGHILLIERLTRHRQVYVRFAHAHHGTHRKRVPRFKTAGAAAAAAAVVTVVVTMQHDARGGPPGFVLKRGSGNKRGGSSSE